MWYYKFIPSLLKQLLSYSSVSIPFKPVLNGQNGKSDFVQTLRMSLHKAPVSLSATLHNLACFAEAAPWR